MDTPILFFIIVFFTWWILGKIFPKKKKNTYVAQPVQTKQTTSQLMYDSELVESFMKSLLNVAQEIDDIKKSAMVTPANDELLDETIQEVMSEMKFTAAEKPQTEDAVTALKKLGYKQNAITNAISQVINASGNKTLSTADIVTKSLNILNK